MTKRQSAKEQSAENEGKTGARLRYTPAMDKITEDMARRGHTVEQIAAFLKVSVPAFYTYTKKFPAFREALDRGRDDWYQLALPDALQKSAYGHEYAECEYIRDRKTKKMVLFKKKIKYIPPNPKSLQFAMINRDGKRWSNKIEHEHGVKDGLLDEVLNLTRGTGTKLPGDLLGADDDDD